MDSHFFDELGANSLLMARYNAALREQTALPSVSMKDIYQYPTVRKLAASLEPEMPTEAPGEARPQPVARYNPYQPPPWLTAQPTGTPHYFLCGALQLLTVAAGIAGGALLLNAGFSWALGARGVLLLPQILEMVGQLRGVRRQVPGVRNACSLTPDL